MELTPNKDLRAAALAALDKKWTPAVVFTLVYMVIAGLCGAIPFLNIAATLLVLPVLAYGMEIVFLNMMRTGAEPKIDALFDGFKDYGKTLGTMLLMMVYIWLWTLLLVIPGIIKAYSYAMTPYILKDEPELGADAVITKSMAMMQGNKMKLFLLDLSFIGWMILAMITLGIGLLWLVPYMQNARAAFYMDLKRTQEPQTVAA